MQMSRQFLYFGLVERIARAELVPGFQLQASELREVLLDRRTHLGAHLEALERNPSTPFERYLVATVAEASA